MASPTNFLLRVLLLAASAIAVCSQAAQPTHFAQPFNRSSFPPDFIFGVGSAAYQYEGAAFTDGRTASIWDVFAHQHPEKIAGGGNGDIALDFYHRYKEDIQLVKKIGLDSFRFSISWSRVLPKGKLSGGVNPLGVKFYNDLINDLIANGIKPFVTLLHFDTPQVLQEEYVGFLDQGIVKHFVDFSEFCFKTFGDRVKHWVTMNEPNGWTIFGYDSGTFAPGRCSSYAGNCSAGNSAIEPYKVAHNLLLAHAAVVRLYREKYKPTQKGEIGITIVTHWFMPKFNTAPAISAASRATDFFFGWFVHPVVYGRYPESMVAAAGSRLPKFSPIQSELLKGSIDFLAINYYTSQYAEPGPLTSNLNASYAGDRRTTFSTEKNGVPIGIPTALGWLHIYPQGLKELLLYIKNKYNNPPIIITENGMADAKNDSLPIKEALKDSLRIRYHAGHLRYLLQAIKEGVNVKGYYIWTFLDDFEWDAGYTVRFGIGYIDFKDNLKRYLKYSAYWFKKFLLH